MGDESKMSCFCGHDHIHWGPFQCINCGAVVPSSIVSEYHKRGVCLFPDLEKCEKCDTWHMKDEHIRPIYIDPEPIDVEKECAEIDQRWRTALHI